jgi:hypothetical protein
MTQHALNNLLNQNATNFDDLDNATVESFDPAASPLATPKAAAIPQALYLTEPGEATAIDVYDINQGQLGDCFLLSSIGEIALLKPTFIASMIHANSNGTETVTLYKAANGALPGFNTTSFKATTATVTNVFPSNSVDNGATQDVVNGVKEIWPQVLENAVAQLDGGYSAIANGGNPVIAMEELTGHAATYMSPSALTLAALLGFSNAGDLIVMDTASRSSLPNSLVGNHAYMFDGVTGSGSSAAVKLLNPWGNDEPTPILMSQLSKSIVEVDIGHLS